MRLAIMRCWTATHVCCWAQTLPGDSFIPAGQRSCRSISTPRISGAGIRSAIGLQKAQPGRQVVCLAGDGGISMLFGDLMTVVQQELPIKIAVFDNGKLGFVEIEQKAEGMLDTFTKLKNPNFAEVARAIGLWGQTVSKANELEGAAKRWLSQPGPALLHVHVNPMQLVMPPFT